MKRSVGQGDDVWNYQVYADIARALIELALRPSVWMHRRVETIDFIDDIRVRRHISIDFTIPDWPSYEAVLRALPQGSAIVPIVRLKKGFPLRDFDVRDESGSALPLLTKRQNQSVGAAILILIAIAVAPELGRAKIPPATLSELAELVNLDSARDAEKKRKDLVKRFAGSGDPLKQALANNEFLQWAMKVLAKQYILCAILRAAPKERRVIKFVYVEHLVQRLTKARIAEWGAFRGSLLGWRPFEIAMPVVVGEWEATHIEVPAPEELLLERPVLTRGNRQFDEFEDGPSRRVHIRCTRQDAGLYTLRLRFRLLPGGMVRAATFLSALTTALLLGGLAVRVGLHAHPAGEAPAAILLAIPGVLAAFIFSPGHHRLFEQLFTGLRDTALGLAFVSIAAAAVMAVSAPPGWRLRLWFALTITSVGAFVVTAVSWAVNRLAELRMVRLGHA